MISSNNSVSIIMIYKLLSPSVILAAAIAAAPAHAATPSSKASTSAKVIFTGEIGKKIYGYNGTTPLNIYVKDNKIEKIEALKNQESPAYFNKAKNHIFPQFVGKTVSQALAVEADAATGATYSSEAIIKNIKLGLKQANASSSKKSAKSKKAKKAKSSR